MSPASGAAEAVSAALRGSSSFSCVCLSFPFAGAGVVGHRFVGPPATPGFWTLTILGCAVLTPSPLAAPSPFVVVDFFLGCFFGLGLVGSVRALVPTFWWCSTSLVLCFAWQLWPFGSPGTCYFLGSYLGFFPLASSVGCCLRWLRFILGCPPSVASLWRLLPGLFVWSLLACPRGTAVPLASWVLWCS